MDSLRPGTTVRLTYTAPKKSNSPGYKKPSLDYYDKKNYTTEDPNTHGKK